MKKFIIGLSVLAVMAVVVILFVNAQSSTPQEVKKPAKETTTGCGGCAGSSAACAPKNEAKAGENVKSSGGSGTATADVKKDTKACCSTPVKK
ncbi:MAG: hypothetical protein MUE32_02655 [Bacteroidales bacterium]|jgi:hypothetical protein|nr:hypothetical protein [Bacteroidales bacterium]